MSDTAVQLSRQVVIDAGDISRRERVVLHPGVTHTVLWRDGHDTAGRMWIEPDAEVPAHTHRRSEHHVWVVSGRARIGDRELGPGGYWHVPPGVEHHLEACSAQGCTLSYLFVRRFDA